MLQGAPPGLSTNFVQVQNQSLSQQPPHVRLATGSQAVNSNLLLGATQCPQIRENSPVLGPGPPLVGGQHPPPPQHSQTGWAKARSSVPPLLLGQCTENAPNWQQAAICQPQGGGCTREITPQGMNTHEATTGNLQAQGNSEGFRSAGSAEIHVGGCGANLAHHGVPQVYQQVPSMTVLPPSWQHQVGHHAEQPFAGPVNLDQQLQPQPLDTDDRLLAARLSGVVRLAEYHLAAPAPAGSHILQLVSQAGLEIGDFLMIEPGTMQQEMNMVVDFGSIILGAPLRNDHARGAQIMFAAPQHQPATAEQRQVIRNEARRHHQRAHAIASQGAVSESVDSLDGFVANGAWSQVEKEHHEERYRRKARETGHAAPAGSTCS